MINIKDIKTGNYYYEDRVDIDNNNLLRVMSIIKTLNDYKIFVRYVDKTSGHWCVKEEQYYCIGDDSNLNWKLYDHDKRYVRDYEWLGGKVLKRSKYEVIENA